MTGCPRDTPIVRQVVVRTESPELTVELTLEPLEERLDPRSRYEDPARGSASGGGPRRAAELRVRKFIGHKE